MKLLSLIIPMVALVLVLFAVGCSSAALAPAEPTPNIDATVEARVKAEIAAQATPTKAPTNTPVPTAILTPTPGPSATAIPTPGPTATATPTPRPTATATATPRPTPTPGPTATATPRPTPIANLWVRELLDEVEANEIVAGQNYTDKWLSVTGHVSHLGGAVWPRSGYEIKIEDVGDWLIKNNGTVHCYPQSSQEPLLAKLVKGDRITVKGIVEELEGQYLATVRLKSCLIEDITFNPEPIDPSCVSLLQGSHEDGYGYLTVEFTAQNNCDVAVWFAVAGSSTFLNNQTWSFTVTDYGGDYFVISPDEFLVEEDMVEKPNWADGRPGEVQAVDLDIVLASDTGLPVDKSTVFD